jgi:hypothetical protein
MENIAKLNNIIEIYDYNRITPSNIQPELEVIYNYAKSCDIITEFGFGRGKSSSAMIAAKPKKVISYDICDHWALTDKWKKLATEIGVEFIYIQKSSIEVDIELTDMLFIDSWHTYEHKTKELDKHHSKVKKWIIIHDWKTCANIGEDGSKPGFKQAVMKFLFNHFDWKIKEECFNHNGYIIMERI